MGGVRRLGRRRGRGRGSERRQVLKVWIELLSLDKESGQ